MNDQKIFFCFRCISVTTAKLDNFSFLQIKEIPNGKTPQQPKCSFAKINSAPSIDRGEHWVINARLDKIYYLANSLGRKVFSYSFLRKNSSACFDGIFKYDNFCGFYAIKSAILLFNLYQRNLTYMM